MVSGLSSTPIRAQQRRAAALIGRALPGNEVIAGGAPDHFEVMTSV
jgi:hypothetical protein